MSKAPEAKVAEERAKLEKYEQMMEQVKLRLEQLQGNNKNRRCKKWTVTHMNRQ